LWLWPLEGLDVPWQGFCSRANFHAWPPPPDRYSLQAESLRIPAVKPSASIRPNRFLSWLGFLRESSRDAQKHSAIKCIDKTVCLQLAHEAVIEKPLRILPLGFGTSRFEFFEHRFDRLHGRQRHLHSVLVGIHVVGFRELLLVVGA